MRGGWLLGAATLATVFALSGVFARADDDVKAELEKYKQRTESLEKKMDQIEALEAQKGATMEEQIRLAAEKIAEKREKEKGEPKDFRVYWDQGLHFASADSAFTGHIGGRIQMDAFFDHQSDQLKKTWGMVRTAPRCEGRVLRSMAGYTATLFTSWSTTSPQAAP